MAQENSAAETIVGPSVKIQGDLVSEGNIRIEGSVSGKVHTTQSVHVGEGAVISADMQAGNAIIAGQLAGNIKVSGNLILQATARVNGDIACGVLRVEDGALFSGKCNMKGATIDKSKLAGAESKGNNEPEAEK